jgi:uncharacterized protein (TIGR00369 family)
VAAHTRPEVLPPATNASAAEWARWAEGLANSRQLGLERREIGPGHAVMRLRESPWAINPNGSVHGGLILAAADQCMGIVAVTAIEPGLLPMTATLNAEFHRPSFAPLSLRGRVTRRGQSFLFVAVDVEDERGRLCARCTGSMAIRDDAFHRPQADAIAGRAQATAERNGC